MRPPARQSDRVKIGRRVVVAIRQCFTDCLLVRNANGMASVFEARTFSSRPRIPGHPSAPESTNITTETRRRNESGRVHCSSRGKHHPADSADRAARQREGSVHDLVRVEHHDADDRHRIARDHGVQAAVLVGGARHARRQPDRRGVHGAAFGAGAAARRAADDPDPRAVRVVRRAARGRAGGRDVCGLLRVELRVRRAGAAQPERRHSARCGRRGDRPDQPARIDLRLQADPRVCAAVELVLGQRARAGVRVDHLRARTARRYVLEAFAEPVRFLGAMSVAALWQIAYAPYVSDYRATCRPIPGRARRSGRVTGAACSARSSRCCSVAWWASRRPTATS